MPTKRPADESVHVNLDAAASAKSNQAVIDTLRSLREDVARNDQRANADEICQRLDYAIALAGGEGNAVANAAAPTPDLHRPPVDA